MVVGAGRLPRRPKAESRTHTSLALSEVKDVRENQQSAHSRTQPFLKLCSHPL